MSNNIPCPYCRRGKADGKWCAECNGTGQTRDQRDMQQRKLIMFAEIVLDLLGRDDLRDITYDLKVIAVQMRLGTEDTDGNFRKDD